MQRNKITLTNVIKTRTNCIDKSCTIVPVIIQNNENYHQYRSPTRVIFISKIRIPSEVGCELMTGVSSVESGFRALMPIKGSDAVTEGLRSRTRDHRGGVAGLKLVPQNTY
ncbi:hypothetical protein TNCT_3611 [Trichonephila clavata]|uniref:Uncharacterized protein n=1 Tax=Trichonephila clavata TaxID=2740835 RepID=A0A8X6FNC3_TRICU|nr:hypothetical protein TNCT_3611 [Trichonephila clavata]